MNYLLKDFYYKYLVDICYSLDALHLLFVGLTVFADLHVKYWQRTIYILKCTIFVGSYIVCLVSPELSFAWVHIYVSSIGIFTYYIILFISYNLYRTPIKARSNVVQKYNEDIIWWLKKNATITFQFQIFNWCLLFTAGRPAHIFVGSSVHLGLRVNAPYLCTICRVL